MLDALAPYAKAVVAFLAPGTLGADSRPHRHRSVVPAA